MEKEGIEKERKEDCILTRLTSQLLRAVESSQASTARAQKEGRDKEGTTGGQLGTFPGEIIARHSRQALRFLSAARLEEAPRPVVRSDHLLPRHTSPALYGPFPFPPASVLLLRENFFFFFTLCCRCTVSGSSLSYNHRDARFLFPYSGYQSEDAAD
ncbi:hypothetical protein PoB_004801100 [Plakobranchus ocellatus]|uniref:Uncharacterized protein n=1 Tax=Plakobranchus ocellatus TaxID=259542 RepID=A0AAV4BDS4_9GAST|nr:hypothetical protein PoB_004801100 [Plakobranchus ocellatus]